MIMRNGALTAVEQDINACWVKNWSLNVVREKLLVTMVGTMTGRSGRPLVRALGKTSSGRFSDAAIHVTFES